MSEGMEQNKKQEEINHKEESEKVEKDKNFEKKEKYSKNQEKLEKTQFKEIFGNIENKEGISQQAFQDIYKELLGGTSQQNGPEALNTLQEYFCDSDKLENNATNIVSMMFVVERLSEKGVGDINAILNNKFLEEFPAKIQNQISGINDKAHDLIENTKKKQKNKKEEEKLEGEEEKLEGEEEKLEGEEKNLEQIRERALENINSRLEENPELKKMFDQKAEELAQKTGMDASDDSFKLSVFKLIHENNPDFAEKYGEIDDTVKSGLDTVGNDMMEKVSSAFFEVSTKALDTGLTSNPQEEIHNEIQKFASNNEKVTEFKNNELTKEQSENLLVVRKETIINSLKENIDTYKEIKDKDDISAENMYQDMVDWIDNPTKNEQINSLFQKIFDQTKKDFEENHNSKLNKEVKEQTYMASINKMFQMQQIGIGIDSLQRDSAKELCKINNKGEIEMNAVYEGVPITIEIDKEGNVWMNNYLGEKGEDQDKQKGTYSTEMKKINNFFSFVNINELTGSNFSLGEILDNVQNQEQINQNLSNIVEEKISQKVNETNKMGNNEMMKNEMQGEMKKQKAVYEFMENYRPPTFNMESYENGNKEISELGNPDIFNFIKAIDNTINYKSQGLDTLSEAINNDKFEGFLESIGHIDKKINTSQVLNSLGILGSGENQTISMEDIHTSGDFVNISKLKDFNKKLNNITSQSGTENLPQINGYKWEYKNGTVGLKEEKKEDKKEKKGLKEMVFVK